MHISKSSTIRPSRRAVIKAAVGCGAMSSVSMASTFLSLQASRAMAESNNPNDFKTLVCVFLNGGNDSFNMLAPTGGEYADYSTARGGVNNGGIAIPENQLLSINGPAGRTFGLHPDLESDLTDANSASSGNGVHGLFNSDRLSFVANIGSLVQPTSNTTYRAQSNLPLGLFSHADLQRHWMSGVPQDRAQLKGWGGKMADIVRDCNDPSSISMNISLSGVNIFQTGSDVTPYSIATNGATPINNYFADLSATNNARYRAFSQIQTDLLGETYRNLMSQTLADTHKISLDAAIQFNNVVNVVQLATPFDTDGLSQRLKKVAQVIGARTALGQRRQVFFVQLGGFDNHANLIADHSSNMTVLSRALSSFYEATEELNMANDVVTFTASDFSRTLSSNGQGSDHAWGGNHIIMGGPINGGQILGDYPTSLVNPVDSTGETINVGRGRLIPTTSVDQYVSEIASWFGVPASQLVDVMPNLPNFSDAPALNMFA
ncbi:MAG: DUF1501 domain-containing protein [Rubripirellula sp.]